MFPRPYIAERSFSIMFSGGFIMVCSCTEVHTKRRKEGIWSVDYFEKEGFSCLCAGTSVAGAKSAFVGGTKRTLFFVRFVRFIRQGLVQQECTRLREEYHQ